MRNVQKKAKNVSVVETSEARKNFSEIVSRSAFGKERIIFSRNGKHAVAIVPIEDLKLLERLEDEVDLREAKKALKDAKKNGTVAWEKVKAELKLK